MKFTFTLVRTLRLCSSKTTGRRLRTWRLRVCMSVSVRVRAREKRTQRTIQRAIIFAQAVLAVQRLTALLIPRCLISGTQILRTRLRLRLARLRSRGPTLQKCCLGLCRVVTQAATSTLTRTSFSSRRNGGARRSQASSAIRARCTFRLAHPREHRRLMTERGRAVSVILSFAERPHNCSEQNSKKSKKNIPCCLNGLVFPLGDKNPLHNY